MSLTSFGIFTAVAGTLLMRFGFSEVCSNEIVANLPLVIGGLIAQYGRWRKGGITPLGFRKPAQYEA